MGIESTFADRVRTRGRNGLALKRRFSCRPIDFTRPDLDKDRFQISDQPRKTHTVRFIVPPCVRSKTCSRLPLRSKVDDEVGLFLPEKMNDGLGLIGDVVLVVFPLQTETETFRFHPRTTHPEDFVTMSLQVEREVDPETGGAEDSEFHRYASIA